jgi:hypothetical protein
VCRVCRVCRASCRVLNYVCHIYGVCVCVCVCVQVELKSQAHVARMEQMRKELGLVHPPEVEARLAEEAKRKQGGQEQVHVAIWSDKVPAIDEGDEVPTPPLPPPPHHPPHPTSRAPALPLGRTGHRHSRMHGVACGMWHVLTHPRVRDHRHHHVIGRRPSGSASTSSGPSAWCACPTTTSAWCPRYQPTHLSTS